MGFGGREVTVLWGMSIRTGFFFSFTSIVGIDCFVLLLWLVLDTEGCRYACMPMRKVLRKSESFCWGIGWGVYVLLWLSLAAVAVVLGSSMSDRIHGMG